MTQIIVRMNIETQYSTTKTQMAMIITAVQQTWLPNTEAARHDTNDGVGTYKTQIQRTENNKHNKRQHTQQTMTESHNTDTMNTAVINKDRGTVLRLAGDSSCIISGPNRRGDHHCGAASRSAPSCSNDIISIVTVTATTRCAPADCSSFLRRRVLSSYLEVLTP